MGVSTPLDFGNPGGIQAPPAGFEPATVGLEVQCSIRLSYEGMGKSVRPHPSQHSGLNIATAGRAQSERRGVELARRFAELGWRRGDVPA